MIAPAAWPAPSAPSALGVFDHAVRMPSLPSLAARLAPAARSCAGRPRARAGRAPLCPRQRRPDAPRGILRRRGRERRRAACATSPSAPDGDLYAATRRGGRAASWRSATATATAAWTSARPSAPAAATTSRVHDGYLYLALERSVVRWRLTPGQLEPAGEPETIVGGPARRRRPQAKTLAFPGGDVMLVKIGSATNSCQQDEPEPESPGRDPCTELERRAGHLALRRRPRGAALRRRPALGDGPPERRGARRAAGDERGLGRDARARPAGRQLGLQRRGQRQQSGRGAGAGLGGRRLRLALLLLQQRRDTRRCSRPSTAATGKRSAGARRPRTRRSRSPATGRRWRSRSIRATSSGPAYTGGLFITFHGSWNRAPLPQDGLPRGVRAVRRRQADGHVPDLRQRTEGRRSSAGGAGGGKDGALFSRPTTNEQDLADQWKQLGGRRSSTAASTRSTVRLSVGSISIGRLAPGGGGSISRWYLSRMPGP